MPNTSPKLLALLIGLGLGLGVGPNGALAHDGSNTTPAPALQQSAAPTAASTRQPIQQIAGVSEYRLANGLTVLLSPDESKPSMTINMVYKVGARQEGPGEAGMAHLLEHMLFKGTERHPDPKKELTRRGIEWNGTTWYDRTNYFGQFNASDATRDWMLGWLADTMVNIRVTPEALQSERPIVVNEMQARDNNPASALYQELMAAAYGFHPYSRAVIGVESDLDGVSAASLQAFYRTYYRPDNAVLIITGHFDEAPTLAAVEKAFGAIPKPDTTIPQSYTLDPAQQGERDVVVRRAGGVPLLLTGYHTPAAADRDSAALSVLADMLTREPDGVLYQRLVKSGLAVRIGASLTDLHDPGMLVISTTLASEAKRAQLWEEMRKVLEQELPISQESLDRSKQDFRNYFKRMEEDPDSLAMALTEAVAQGDWRLLFAQQDWIEQLTLDDVRKAGQRWLVRDNRTLAWYLPTTQTARAPRPSRPDIPALLQNHPWKQAEAFTPDVPLTPESITEKTRVGQLPGGLRYALLPRRVKGDRVHVRLNLQWGNLDNLWGRWPEADMLGAMLPSGTRSLPRQAFEDKLRGLDADLNIHAEPTGVQLSLSVPSKNLNEALALSVSALREPVFPEDLFKERQERILSSIEAQRHQPESLAAQAFAEQGHAYPENDPRHYRSLDQLVRDVKVQSTGRLQAFWQDFAGASDGQFSAVGDFSADELREQLQQLLGDWKSPKAYARIDKEYHGIPSKQLQVDVPDKANAVFLQGRNIAISEDHPDYTALMMAIHMFGGSPDARLANRLREKESLTYGVHASLTANRKIDNAMIDIRAIHAPANLARLQTALQEEIDRAVRDGFRQQELDEARSALLDLRRQFLTGEANVSSLLASNLFWQTDMRRWIQRTEQIEKLGIDEINTVFRRWFDPDKALTINAGSFPQPSTQ